MKFNKIKAVAFDFDGVFTDNRVIVSEDGKESVQCNRADGIGLEMLRQLNIPMIIISSETNPVVIMRANKLKIPAVNGVKNKLQKLTNFASKNNVDLNDLAYLGNDVNDELCMLNVGFPICVADSVNQIKNISKYILNKNGGDAAVRELCEKIFTSYNND